jgi:hypothetical protein
MTDSRVAGASLTICGSGNAAHALAVVASQHLDGEIDWLAGSTEKAALLRHALNAHGLRSTGVIQATADRIRNISADPAEVIPHSEIVLIVVPAFGHAAVLDRIAPYVGTTTAVGCMPTRGGFEFEASRLTSSDGHRPIIFGLQTSPWSTRVKTLGQIVHIGAVKEEVVLAAMPAADGPQIAARLATILGTRVLATHGFLGLTLGNPGQFIHPGLIYGHFRAWHGEEYDEEAIPLLYAQATEEIGDVVDRLSQESIAVASALERQSGGTLELRDVVIPIHEWLRNVYGAVTADTSTVASCFRTGPIQARKAPMIEVRPGRFLPDFEYRYLSEDVPFGLVSTRALAEIAGVATPVIDEVVTWAQSAMHKSYLVGNGLTGPDAQDLPLPQNYGVSTVSDLLAWDREDPISRRPRRAGASEPR